MSARQAGLPSPDEDADEMLMMVLIKVIKPVMLMMLNMVITMVMLMDDRPDERHFYQGKEMVSQEVHPDLGPAIES